MTSNPEIPFAKFYALLHQAPGSPSRFLDVDARRPRSSPEVRLPVHAAREAGELTSATNRGSAALGNGLP